jgi:hypothetical protein
MPSFYTTMHGSEIALDLMVLSTVGLLSMLKKFDWL